MHAPKLVALCAALLALQSLSACGQPKVKPQTGPVIQQGNRMDTTRITNPVAKSAFEAWQAKDLSKWLGHFTPDAKLYDDGKARDLKKFSAEIGKERFTSIDVVENDGKDIFGQFHSDSWGNFKTYFKFSIDAGGKVTRLDIGQADY